MIYRKTDERYGLLPKDRVRRAGSASRFWCPCGQRLVTVTSPPDKVTFDRDGVMTIDNACSAPSFEAHSGPDVGVANWCHFRVMDGRPTMEPDAKCPGAEK